jgi:hypothetical protein
MTKDSVADIRQYNEVTAWVMLNLFQHLVPDLNRLKSFGYTGYHYNFMLRIQGTNGGQCGA